MQSHITASGTSADPPTEERHPTDSFPTNSQSALWDLSVDEEKDTIRLNDVEDIMDFVFKGPSNQAVTYTECLEDETENLLYDPDDLQS